MDYNGQHSRIEEVKEMDMVVYLSAIGFEPSKIRGNDYWYFSPLREEKIPSFKINRKLNRWYDHGLGKGGNLLDFGILFYHCSVRDFLRRFQTNIPFHQPTIKPRIIEDNETAIAIVQAFSVSSISRIQYLNKRKISLVIAELFCQEVRFTMNGKTYYALGFKNDSGGYELRNRFLKLSSHPKDMTTIKIGSKEVGVFEGFFDFLSYQVLVQQGRFETTDYIILNSLAFFEKATPLMEYYDHISLYLDNDEAGQNCSRKAMAASKIYTDKSSLYKNYKDLNHWLVNGWNDSS